MKTRIIVISSIVVVGALAVFAFLRFGADSFRSARGRGDAPVGTTNDDKAHIVNFPDQFPNVATKCSGIPGKRVWVTTHGGNARTLVIEDDESC